MSLVCVGGSPGPRVFICIEVGVGLLWKESGGEHLFSEEGKRGLLRPSLEETLASDGLRLVGEEETVVVVGTDWIWFLMFFIYFLLVFL